MCAALIMVVLFSGFAAGEMVSTTQFGFGMAVAILLDETVVWSVLVSATMKLLGDRNWYLPGFLSWLPKVRVDGEAAESPTSAAVPASAPAPDID